MNSYRRLSLFTAFFAVSFSIGSFAQALAPQSSNTDPLALEWLQDQSPIPQSENFLVQPEEATSAEQNVGEMLKSASDVIYVDEKTGEVDLQKTKTKEFEKLAIALLQKGDSIFDSDDKSIVRKAIEKQMEIWGKVAKAFHELSLNFTAKQNLKINNTLGLSIGYSYDTNPAYIGKNWYRQDSYFMSLPVHFGDWIKKKFAIFDVTPGFIVEFFRFFENDSAAKTAMPVSPTYFPVSAEKAIALNRGDLAHMQAYANGVFGGQKFWQVWKKFTLHPLLEYIRKAQVDIFVFRAEDQKVRLRLIAHRSRNVLGQLTFGVNDLFKIFPWTFLTNAVVRWTRLDQLIMGNVLYGPQNVFLGDYTLNLADDDVKIAYDNLFRRLGMVHGIPTEDSLLLTLIDPRKSQDQLGELLLALLKTYRQKTDKGFELIPGLDDIYQQDLAQKDHKLRRVDRNFAGVDNAFDRPHSELRYGLQSIAREEKMTIRRDNNLIQLLMDTDGKEVPQYYYFPTWSQYDDKRAGFSLYHRTENQSSNVIYKTNENKVPTEFESIGFYLDLTKKTYKNDEHQKQINHFRKILPVPVFEQFYQELVDDDFATVNGKIKDVRLKARYFINAKGLAGAEKLFDGENDAERLVHMRNIIINHLREIPMTTLAETRLAQKGGGLINNCRQEYKNEDIKIALICDDIEAIAGHLLVIINRKAPPFDRHDKLEVLSKDKLFLEVGPGLLLQLIPADEVGQATFFDIAFYLPSREEPIRFSYPKVNPPEREFYELLRDIQVIMDNMLPDMRLEGTEDTLVTRKTHDAEDSNSFKH